MPELSPDEVTAHTFPTSFRGFDPGEVKAYLARVAERLRMAEERAEELARKLADAEDRAAHPEMDVDTLTSALGDETARILRSAQDAAADIRGKAEENVAQLLREAYEEAGRIRGEAELVLARETEAAEAAAAEIRSAAESDAAAALGRARQEAERVLAQVEAQARAMVEEAEDSRTKILTDLARRRKLAHTQVEQLRAGRERLLEAYRMVRTTLDEVSEELLRAEAEARAAAEAAARRLTEGQFEGDALEVGGDEDVEGDRAIEPAPLASAPAATQLQSEATPEREPAPEPEIAPAADPEPEPESATEAAPQPPADAAPAEAGEPMPRLAVAPPLPEPDERLSSLRIIRRPKAADAEPAPAPAPEPEPEPAPTPTPAEPEARNGFTPVAPATPGEGVRVIKADPPLPEEEPPADEPASDEPPPAEVPVEEAPEPPPGTVDDLFARIRADRADAVAKAREVLDASEPDADAPPEAVASQPEPQAEEPEPAPEPEPEAVPDEDEALLQRRDRVVEDVELRLARRLKRALQDEQNDVLDRLRSAKGRPAPDVVLPSPGEHPERYRQVAAELLYEAARAGTAFVDAADVAVDVGDLAAGLADDLVGPLRRRLERGLEEGADEEAALVVERVGAAYRETKGKRLEQLAADHVIAAFSRGTFLGTPEGAALRWIVDDVGGPCPDCDDNALAGPTPRGEEYPTGRLHPPAHAGCRCLLAPPAP